MKEFVTSFYSFDYITKKTEPSSSDEEDEINLHIQKSSESDSEVAKTNREESTS